MRAPTLWKIPTRSGPAAPSAKAAMSALGGVELRDDRVGVAEQEAAGVGQVDGLGAARAVDELLADAPLEPRDLLAHRRLRVAELAGGARRTSACAPTASRAARWRSSTPRKLLRSIIKMNYNLICANRRRRHAGVMKLAGALGIVYVVWGSTYLGDRRRRPDAAAAPDALRALPDRRRAPLRLVARGAASSRPSGRAGASGARRRSSAGAPRRRHGRRRLGRAARPLRDRRRCSSRACRSSWP